MSHSKNNSMSDNNQSLQILLAMLNSTEQDAEHVNPLGRKLTLKDFDNLTPELLVFIISTILKTFDESCLENINKTGRLLEFEQLGISCSGPQTYDSTIDNLYSVAKKFFPDGDDTLDMSVLLCPKQDIKRAKQVLTYLVACMLFCDTVIEKFRDAWDNLNLDNEEKSVLCAEIEALKAEISSKTAENKRKTELLPELKKKLSETEEELLREQAELAKLEELAKSEKKNYDEKSSVNRRLQAKLQELNLEKGKLEDQIVHSASEILETHSNEKQKLKEELRKRDVLGKELRTIGLKEQFVTEVIEKAQSSIKKFKELIATMQNVGESLAAYHKDQQDYQSKQKEIAEIKKTVAQLERDNNRIEKELNQRAKFFEEECGRLNNLKNNHIWDMEKMKSTQNKINDASREMECEIQNIISEIQGLSLNISRCKHFCEVVIPNRMKAMNDLQQESMEEITNFLKSDNNSNTFRL